MRSLAFVHRPDDLDAVRMGASLGEVTAVSIGRPGGATEALLESARTAGAVRTLQIWDEALDATDYLGIAATLAQTVRAILKSGPPEPIVILCGGRGRNAVGPALAERLSLPHLGGVIGCRPDEDRLIVRRREGGRVRLYAGHAPLVLCVTAAPGLSNPEAAGWTRAVASTESWTLAEIGLSAPELTYRKRFQLKPSLGPTITPRRFADVTALLTRLRSDGFWSKGS